jgi:hypothetical protein
MFACVCVRLCVESHSHVDMVQPTPTAIYFSPTHTHTCACTQAQEQARISALEESPLTQKFLVGTVPCLLQFSFDNSYSWLREKVVSYKVTVTPPTIESLQAGRRRRAAACLKAVQDDLEAAETRLRQATVQKLQLLEQVQEQQQVLAETKKAAQVAEKEEAWLKERRELRVEQQKLLVQRLEHGWDDERDMEASAKK